MRTIPGQGDRTLLYKEGKMLESYNNAATTDAYADGWEDVTGHPLYEAQCTEFRNADSAKAAP